MKKNAVIGVLGTGKMGGAIIRGISSLTPYRVICFDKSPEALEAISTLRGVKIASSPEELHKGAEAVIIAVKPADVEKALRELNPPPEAVLISVAAGVRTQKIKTISRVKHVCRVMPNLAVEIGSGVAGCWGDKKAVKIALKIFGALGYAFEVKNEDALDALTGLGGSAPAFVAVVIEALSDGGVLVGFSRNESLEIAKKVLRGTVELLEKNNLHPALFREMVTSPGGTTIEGLSVLEDYRVRKAFMEAIRKAVIRAKELAGG